MTKMSPESDPNECNNNCCDFSKTLENQELILNIIEENIKSKQLNDWNKCDKNDSDVENVKFCEICTKNFLIQMNKLDNISDKLTPTDNSINTYGSIKPVVVINVFEDQKEQQMIEKEGIINEAFLNDDENRFDLKIIPETECSEGETETKRQYNCGHREDLEIGHSDKRRTSSKRSKTSNLSFHSNQLRAKAHSRRRSSGITSNASEKRRESIRNMLFGYSDDMPELSLRRFSQDIRKTVDEKELIDEYETYRVIFLQVFLPFLIAGFGNVGAGLILNYVQYWDVFESVTELFILIASFLGFKGNLEMTLAARLSTQANLGNLDKPAQQWKMGVGNVVLVQCQAIVVALLAAIFAISVNVIKEGRMQTDHCFLILATSLITASVTGFFLSSLMIVVIIIARKAGVNPDNCSTLIAAFLGDISAVVMLSGIAKLLFIVRNIVWIAPTFILLFLAILPLFISIARNNEYTREVLHKSWYPIIIAMFISSIGGFIFDFSVSIFETIAIFQPIINGVGANLVAVQASRISTYLHQRCSLGEKPPINCQINTSICQLPHNVFIGSHTNVRTARLLLVMAVPGHLIYIITIWLIKWNQVSLSVPFIGTYLLVALIQVSILLYMAHILVPFLWTKKIDPDNSAIPGIMALGDLIGTALLTVAYMLLNTIGDPNVLSKSNE